MGTLLWQPPRAVRNILTYEFLFSFPQGIAPATFDSADIPTLIDWSVRQIASERPADVLAPLFNLRRVLEPVSKLSLSRMNFSRVSFVPFVDAEYSIRQTRRVDLELFERSLYFPGKFITCFGRGAVLSADWRAKKKESDSYSYAVQGWKWRPLQAKGGGRERRIITIK